MSGPKVVETGSLNVTDVIGLAVFLALFSVAWSWYMRHPRVIRGLSAARPTFRVTSRGSPFCTSLNGQK